MNNKAGQVVKRALFSASIFFNGTAVKLDKQNNNCILAMLLPALMLSASSLVAGERIGFEAEHVLESPMNARYLALPAIPDDINRQEFRLQTGLSKVSATRFGTTSVMLGVEYFMPQSGDTGFLFSFFTDFLRFDGDSGRTTFDPLFLDTVPFIKPLDVTITAVNGHAEHYGITAARVSRLSVNNSWQYGVALEYYDVGEFSVAFDTVGLASNFSAVVDYAETYIAATPFVTFRHKFNIADSSYRYAARILAAWPLPRQGFSGHLQFNGFDQSGSTDTAGNGKHIPDPYAGIGFSISSPQYHWQLDIGASLYFFATEGLIHEGIDNPLFLNITWQL